MAGRPATKFVGHKDARSNQNSSAGRNGQARQRKNIIQLQRSGLPVARLKVWARRERIKALRASK